jgi:WS/DGAT/MGAT family acyltransferase
LAGAPDRGTNSEKDFNDRAVGEEDPMPRRLSSFDASFLDVESPQAHMHVGWVALLAPPDGRAPPRFEEVSRHIEGRLPRAPRYRQRLAGVPFGLASPVWVDDERFAIEHHVLRSDAREIDDLVDAVMSAPLGRDRPLWEIWIADRLGDGRLALVGKAHHCMVDGIAAVELASLLLDPTPEAPPPERDGWRPRRPAWTGLVTGAVGDRLREGIGVAALPLRGMRSPGELVEMGRRAAAALASSMSPATPARALNEPISPYRHLARLERPIADLVAVKRRFGTTLNDVLLSIVAGGIRTFVAQRGAVPVPLKAMVPVNVRDEGSEADLGNRISFMFVELPCHEPDPVRRLRDIHLATSEHKRRGVAEGGDAVLRAFEHAPHPLQVAAARLIASPRTFNLVVSNIPGPREALYMLGCRLEEAYPVVPLADRHALSVGFTSVGDRGCFGLYADRMSLPDADVLAGDIDAALDELLAQRRRRVQPLEPALA